MCVCVHTRTCSVMAIQKPVELPSSICSTSAEQQTEGNAASTPSLHNRIEVHHCFPTSPQHSHYTDRGRNVQRAVKRGTRPCSLLRQAARCAHAAYKQSGPSTRAGLCLCVYACACVTSQPNNTEGGSSVSMRVDISACAMCAQVCMSAS